MLEQLDVKSLRAEYESYGNEIDKARQSSSYKNVRETNAIIDRCANHRHDISEKLSDIVSNVSHYSELEFQKVCDVVEMWHNTTWIYGNMNTELMYSAHTSWVYFIVDGNTIVKVGETGLPLGIRVRAHDQPLAGTTNRFGRLANFKNDATDSRIRVKLKESVRNGKVSLWAKKCPITVSKISLAGDTLSLKKTFHKELELSIIDYMSAHHYWPELNVSRK